MTNRQVLTTAILVIAISMSIAGLQDAEAHRGYEPPVITSVTPTIDGAIVEWTQEKKSGFNPKDFTIESDSYENEVNGNIRTDTITGLECGTEYEVEVTADWRGHSDLSDTEDYETLACEPESVVVEVHCEVEYDFEMFLTFGERSGYGECIYIFADESYEEHEVHVEGSFEVGSLEEGFRTIDGDFHIEDYDYNSIWLEETGSIEIDCDIETEEEEEFETPYCLETDVTVAGGEGIFSFLEGEGTREATGYFTTEFIFTNGYAYSTIWIFFCEEGEECGMEEEEPEVEPEEEDNNGGGGDDRHKTAPTSGNDWNTFENLVEGGITVDRVSFTLTDNWYTPFEQIQIETGSTHSFGVKTFAQNGGIMVQEIAFGITAVGDYANAEALVEVHYDWDKTILELVVVQDTEVLDVLSVSTDQVLCRSEADAICYQTNLTIKFNEPLKDKVYAVKAFDMTRRTMMPHYFNEGINIFGDSLNPMLTKQIASTEKFEGLILITQTEKYSNLWVAEDGRIFDSDNYFTQTNKVYEQGTNDKRGSEIMQQIADGQAYLASQLYFDSSKIQGEDGGFIAAIVDTDGDHREQTLQKLVWNISD